MVNKNYFSKIDTHNKAYVLGILAADGSVKNKYVVRLSIRDKDILHSISKDIYQGEDRVTIHKNNGMYSLNMCSKDLVFDLNNHGIIPNKTDKLEHKIDIIDEFYCSFVLGYFDGDGTINTRSKSESIKILGTKDFLNSMRDRVKSICGTEGKIYFVKNHLYRLEYSGSNKIKPFIKWLYSGDSFSLERKRVKSLFLLKNQTLKEVVDKSVKDFLQSGESLMEFSKRENINYLTIRSRLRRRKHV